MAFAGLRGTGDWGTDERPKNFRETILWRQPNGSAVLTALMAKMSTQSVDDPEFSWWEEELNVVRLTSSAGGAAASTSFTVSGGALAAVPGDVFLVEKTEDSGYTNEIVMVSSVTDDNTIVFKRGQAGTTAANTGTSVSFTRLGSAFGEGTNSPDVSNNNPTKLYNYCQIFKTAYEMTNTTKKTKARTGDPLKNDKKRRMFVHSTSLETAFMFGKKYETTDANGKPLRFTGGLRQYITTNVNIFSTTPTEDTFLNTLYPVFDYNTDGVGSANERIILAGNGFLNSLNRLARDSSSTQINFTETVKYYGMELAKWVLPQGTVYVKTHPLMNVHARFKYSGFVINPGAIKYRPLRDTKAQDNIQAPDADTHKGQWLSECGMEVQHEKSMAYIGNFVV